MKYIGITGHRGAGKNSIAYLLGNTLQILCHGHSERTLESELYDKMYSHWCDQLMKSENCINNTSLDHVYFDSFSDSIKVFIRLILGCPEEYVYEDKYKYSIVVNLKDLSYKPISDFETEPKLKTANDVYKRMPYEYDEKPIKISSDEYMLLDEFIMYFGFEVMQRFFGKNVWVKILQATNEEYDKFYESSGAMYYKIFSDLKTVAENSFIKQQNGVIVKIIRPNNKKGKSKLHEDVSLDSGVDYNILVDGDLYHIKEKIINLAITINNRFKRDEKIDC